MKQRYFLLIVLLLSPLCLPAQNAPLEFIANQGQWTAPFLFKAQAPGGDIYLEEKGITYMVGAADNFKKVHDYKHNEIKQPPVLKFHAYKVTFEGAQKAESVTGGKLQQHYYNYFLGNDPERWKTEIHPALNVDYRNIYRNIDLHVASENRQMKYDFIVNPGGDPEQIRLKFTGADRLTVKDNKLEISTSVGTVTEMSPYAYQYIDGVRKEVPCRYKLKDGSISYVFPRGYDPGQQLIIDPTVVFATFSGSTADNWGFTATYDHQGNFYAGGIANGTGYPTTTGAFQLTFAGGGPGGGNGVAMNWDIAITKFNPTGSALVFSTYLGGSDNEQPHSLVVDGSGNLVVVGRTYSNDFPVQNAYDNSYNGNADIIVTKFNAGGTALVGATYVGGSNDDGVNISSLWASIFDLKHNYGDDARSEVIVDNSGNVYVAASTISGDFPTEHPFQSTLQGGQDGVVFKLSANLSNMLWSTYLGGTANDASYVLALNTAQSHLFVAGGTASSDFPVTSGTFQPAYNGGSADGYIVKFQNSGSFSMLKGTFIGQGNYDQCYGVQVDGNNNVYAMGQTTGGTFPVTPGVYSNANSSQFVIKLDSTLTNNVYSTVFGSGNSLTCNISPVAFLVDTCEQVYISGWGGPTAGNGGNTNNMPITANAAQSTTDGSDFYFIVLDKDATGLLYGTYYGGSTLGEHVDGGTSRFDKSGVVYQGICGGCGSSSAFPTTPGVWSQTNNSGNCNFAALKIAFQLSSVSAQASASPDTSGCPPLTVQFNNNSQNGVSYDWDFGDGQTSTAATPPPHVYNIPGTYHVRLIVTNPGACNVKIDTSYLTIKVDTNSIKADFDFQVTDSCGPYVASFTNNSTFSQTPGAPNFTKFTWTFGDGSAPITALNPGTHNFPDTGCYVVRLVMEDTSSCNKIDTIAKTICIRGFRLTAAFTADSGCIGKGTFISNASVNAQTIHWDFGDGDTSTTANPLHTYASPGTYTITLIVTNPKACNKSDTARQTVLIKTSPTADFTFTPLIPVPNEPIKFTNLSQNAVSYLWAFGDGTSSNQEHPQHLYKRTDSYKVCLEAKSADGCVDIICKVVDAEIHPAIDVPTGFSPNGDGSNDVLYVRGAAIETVSFKVYNRWGEKVFETDDITQGWDGNFKGKPQEMEAYAWVLNATFVDGSTVSRTGNVTLLR